MRGILILAILALFFASCTEVAELPEPGKVRFCKYEDKDGVPQCKSTYGTSVTDCKIVNNPDASLADINRIEDKDILFCDPACTERVALKNCE